MLWQCSFSATANVCTKRPSVFFYLVSVNNSVLFCYLHHCPGDQNISMKRKAMGFCSASVLEIGRIGLLSPTTEVTTIKAYFGFVGF